MPEHHLQHLAYLIHEVTRRGEFGVHYSALVTGGVRLWHSYPEAPKGFNRRRFKLSMALSLPWRWAQYIMSTIPVFIMYFHDQQIPEERDEMQFRTAPVMLLDVDQCMGPITVYDVAESAAREQFQILSGSEIDFHPCT